MDLKSNDLSGEGNNFGSHTSFLTTQGDEGPPTKQHELERRFTPFTHPLILTRRMWEDDYYGQMIFGDLVDLKLPDICLTDEEKTPKKSLRKLVPTGDWTRARCLTGAHATACSTAVDHFQDKIYKYSRKFGISAEMVTLVLPVNVPNKHNNVIPYHVVWSPSGRLVYFRGLLSVMPWHVL